MPGHPAELCDRAEPSSKRRRGPLTRAREAGPRPGARAPGPLLARVLRGPRRRLYEGLPDRYLQVAGRHARPTSCAGMHALIEAPARASTTLPTMVYTARTRCTPTLPPWVHRTRAATTYLPTMVHRAHAVYPGRSWAQAGPRAWVASLLRSLERRSVILSYARARRIIPRF